MIIGSGEEWMVPDTLRVGVVGFSGYSGAELVKILKRHGGVEVVLLEHRSQTNIDKRVWYQETKRMPWSADSLKEGNISLVFLATPHEVSLELVPVALDAAAKFNYDRWYQMEHNRYSARAPLHVLARAHRAHGRSRGGCDCDYSAGSDCRGQRYDWVGLVTSVRANSPNGLCSVF